MVEHFHRSWRHSAPFTPRPLFLLFPDALPRCRGADTRLYPAPRLACALDLARLRGVSSYAQRGWRAMCMHTAGGGEATEIVRHVVRGVKNGVQRRRGGLRGRQRFHRVRG